MLKTEISQCKKIILFILLILLNLVLRIPSIPHEKGADSFFIHSLANSITTYGHANWWVHWLSVFGYYPYSYASAIPFSLSGLSQITGIEMEKTILLFCIITGLFSIFSAYILAGVIYDEFLFKYLMALIYSTSPSVMFFTTWEISSRGPFIIFLPFFIYLIMKNIKYIKRMLLVIITGIFQFSTHHLAIILVPIISLFIAVNFFSKFKINKKHIYLNYLYATGLATAFLLPFFSPDTANITGSRYGWIIHSLVISIRYIGPMILFAFSGLVYLVFKNNKKVSEWYFLIMIASFISFIYDQIYGIYIVQLYLIAPLTIGCRNLLSLNEAKSPRLIVTVLIMALLLSVTFTSYYNHFRTGGQKDFWYMNEKTYTTGKWINHNIDKENHVLSQDGYHTVRMIALQQNGSSIIVGGPEGLSYGFIDKDSIKNLEKVPITSSYYFSESPYIMTTKDKFDSLAWILEARDVSVVKETYDLEYIVKSPYDATEPIGLHDNCIGKMYSNGVLDIYHL